MEDPLRILIIEDDNVDAEHLRRTLKHFQDEYLDTSFHVEIRNNYSDGLEALKKLLFDLILLDLKLPDVTDIQYSISDLRSQYPDIPLIVMTGLKDKENALQSLRNGAQDYLIKGEISPSELRRSITYAIERHRLKTELEQTISALDQKSSILHSILNHMGDGVVVMDQTGKMTLFNAAAVQMIDISWGKEQIQNWPEEYGVFDPKNSEKISFPELPISKALKGEPVDDEEIKVVSPVFNEERYISVTARPIDDKHHSLNGCVAVLHDITQRRKVEQMKDEFVSIVSHELRTPLTSISGSLGLLLGGVAGILPPKAEEMINIAQRNSERLVRLINDLLDIQKLEAGKLELCLNPIALYPFLQKAISLNAGYGSTYDVSFSFNQDEDHHLYIEGDEDRLLQVMANLLSNAAKFSPPKGIITVSATHAPDNNARIEVNDQGPGIPEEFHAAIFEKFSQADSSPTRAKGGTGLGLSICKSIIDLHKGTIGFDTSPDSGTTFHFQIPLIAGPKNDLFQQEPSHSEPLIT